MCVCACVCGLYSGLVYIQRFTVVKKSEKEGGEWGEEKERAWGYTLCEYFVEFTVDSVISKGYIKGS